MAGRKRLGSVLGVGSALGFLATAGLHATGYSSIGALARQAPEDLRSLVPLLWISFSVDLAVLGHVPPRIVFRADRVAVREHQDTPHPRHVLKALEALR